MWFLSKEFLQRDLSLALFDTFKKKEIVSIEGKDHLNSLLIITLAVDVLDNFRSILVQNEFINLSLNLGS